MLQNPAIQQILISSGLFLLVWAILGNLVFKPFLKILEEREAKTIGSDKEAFAQKKKSQELTVQIEETLKNARRTAMQARDEQTQRARQNAEKIKVEAQQHAELEIAKAREHIARLKENAFKEVAVESDALARQMVEKALSSESRTTIH